MNPSYRRDQDHNYMILESPAPITGEEFPVRMLVLNRIPGVLSCKMRKIDGKAGFYYEITSLQPLSRVFDTRRMEQEDIRSLLMGIEKAMEGVREFLLEPNQLLLEPDYIYMDVETKEVSLCCLPFYEGNAADSFRRLAEYILKKLNHQDQGAVLWGYDIYSKTTEENYSIQRVLECVRGKTSASVLEKREEHSEKQTGNAGLLKEAFKEREKPGQEERQESVQRLAEPEDRNRRKEMLGKGLFLAAGIGATGGIAWAIWAFWGLTAMEAGGIFFLGAAAFVYVSVIWKGFPKKREKLPRLPSEYDAERILADVEEEPKQESEEKNWRELSKEEPASEEEFGATTLLQSSYTGNYAVLVSMEPEKRENIVLDRDILTVGKLSGQADIVLNQTVISRIHAKLERRAEGYFVTDQNSMNGTYVNGTRLEAYESRRLHVADEVYFASAGYYFKG